MNELPTQINSETYFFRDHGQFDLLRRHLLPELIERRRPSKTLRLWSAGCASGEEAYSLAMLLDMLLPQRDDWDIFILGNDINETALVKAQQGRYGPWSFRMAPSALKHRYFHHHADEWRLMDDIRNMVTFRAINLISESFPNAQLRDMDLILCRNVFIYFNAAAVTSVASKLAAALNQGGYLMTAHTELMGHHLPALQSRLFTEGMVYQRVATSPVPPRPQPARTAPTPVVTKRAPNTPSTRSQPCVPQPSVPMAEDPLDAARALADRGEYDQAAQACRQVLSVTPLAPQPHFLLAQLAQIKGDFEQARELLDKTLYLDPQSVAATLELAALCQRTQNLSRAQTLRRAALDIVRTLPANTVIEPYDQTAAELTQWLMQ